MHYIMAIAIVVIALLGDVIGAPIAITALAVIAAALVIDMLGMHRERQRRIAATKAALNARYGRRMQAHEIGGKLVIGKPADIALLRGSDGGKRVGE